MICPIIDFSLSNLVHITEVKQITGKQSNNNNNNPRGGKSDSGKDQHEEPVTGF